MLIALLLVICIPTLKAELDTYNAYIPSGVSFGMSVEQFRSARPVAVLYQRPFESVSDEDQQFAFGELIDDPDPFGSICYHFKARVLGAVSFIYLHNPVEIAAEIRGQMLSGFTKVEDTTARIIVNDAVVSAPLEKWQSSDGAREAFIVSTNSLVRVFVFAPNLIGFDELFPDVESLAQE